MAIVEGIAVSGEYVEGLKDKSFTIIADPYYVDLPNLEAPEKTVRKLLLKVELANKEQLEYYPNKTSIKQITSQYGFEMKNWIGKRFEWAVHTQQAFGKEQKVLMVVGKKLK